MWRFRYSYWASSQSYVFTKGWSAFVKEKKLKAGDIVSFKRSLSNDMHERCVFIICTKPSLASQPLEEPTMEAPHSTDHGASSSPSKMSIHEVHAHDTTTYPFPATQPVEEATAGAPCSRAPSHSSMSTMHQLHGHDIARHL
eukprot:c37919_g1_i1 orf=2-427(+)